MKVQENEKLKEDYRPKISLGIDVVSDVIRLEHQERRKESTFVGCLEADCIYSMGRVEREWKKL